jgi:hypothetical protein
VPPTGTFSTRVRAHSHRVLAHSIAGVDKALKQGGHGQSASTTEKISDGLRSGIKKVLALSRTRAVADGSTTGYRQGRRRGQADDLELGIEKRKEERRRRDEMGHGACIHMNNRLDSFLIL